MIFYTYFVQVLLVFVSRNYFGNFVGSRTAVLLKASIKNESRTAFWRAHRGILSNLKTLLLLKDLKELITWSGVKEIGSKKGVF